MSIRLILQYFLAILARAVIRKYKPVVIAITGSVGKTSVRHAVFAVLKKKYYVRTAEKNYNNEIGVPLTILGMTYKGKNPVAWLGGFLKVGYGLLLRKWRYPEMLVLEYGVDRPGDMDRLVAIAKPDIAVVTAVGDVPAHVEYFTDIEGLIAEKARLVEALSVEGYAVLNHDDYAVYDMKEKCKGKAVTYGFEEHADVRVMNYELQSMKDEVVGSVPEGITFKLRWKGSLVPIRLHHVFGEPTAYAAAAAAAVGVIVNSNLVETSLALREYVPPPGRLRLMKGLKHSFILDDSYNAAPEAMRTALDTLKQVPGKRKIAVLGDMLEIGTYTEQVHRAVGDQAAAFVDVLVTVGARAKFIADEAMTRGVEKNARRLLARQVMSFDDPTAAGRALDPLIQAGDVILVKGSQAMRMEKTVEEIMAFPRQAAELLVRQDEEWKKR